MKKIYIVLTYTGTILSNIIKFYTKRKYSHISLSFDKNLNKMYSFGRKNPYNAFIGGFVEEEINKGTYKRFYNTQCQVYELEITYYKYRKLKRLIKMFQENKKSYKYNTVGLMLFPLNINIKRKNHYYCSEFIRFLLVYSKINENLPILVTPEELVKCIKNKKLIYEGFLNSYKKSI